MSAAFETLRKSNFSSAQQMILRGLEISQSADNRVNFPHELQIFQDPHDLDRLRNHHDLQKIEDPPDLLGVPDLCDLQYPQDIQALQGFQDFVTFMTLSSFVTLQISMAFQGKIWTFRTKTPPPLFTT